MNLLSKRPHATEASASRPEPSGLSGLPQGARALLVAALASVFLGALDLTVIATILVRMIADLGINTADVDRYIWVVNGYLLAYVIAIPIVGRLSDVVGRTPVFLGALAVFVFGSVLCAMATDLSSLIVARAVQGAGGGALLPVTMALVGDLMPPRRRATALGLVGSVDTLGWVLGPIWGATVVAVLGSVDEAWRWVFWINVPLGILAAGAILYTKRRFSAVHAQLEATPETEARPFWHRLDVLGAILFSIVLISLNLALSSGGEVGVVGGRGTRALGGSPNPLADYLWPLLGLSAVGLVAFVLWERRVREPLISLALFKIRTFVAAIAANFLAGAALMVVMVDVPLVVALLVSGSDASWVSAAMLAPFTVMMALLSWVGGRWTVRYGERTTALIGIALAAIGLGGLWLGLQDQVIGWMIPGLLVSGAGFGLVIAPIGASAIDAVAAKARGVAAGLAMVARLLGMTIGISTLTALGVRRLQTLTEKVEPVVQRQGESTAAFLVRQQEYVERYAIPLTVQVIQETFVAAGVIALLGIIPVWFLQQRRVYHDPGRKNETARQTP